MVEILELAHIARHSSDVSAAYLAQRESLLHVERRAERSRQSKAPRPRHVRMVPALTPETFGKSATQLATVGGFGLLSRGGARIPADLMHCLFPPSFGALRAPKPITVLNYSQTLRAPTMFHSCAASG